MIPPDDPNGRGGSSGSARDALKVLCCAAWLLAAAASARVPEAPWAPGGESRGEDLRVSLLTFGPGDELISWWGHTALVVEDLRLRQGRLYNYGMFSFDDRMLWKFALGRLEFWVGEGSIPGTVRAYASDNRTVHLQELNLAPEDRLRMAESLAVNVRVENRTYLYEHYHDNCSSRPRDAIDIGARGQLRKATSVPGRMTLRKHTQRYTSVNPAMSVFLDFMMNDSIDKPIPQSAEAFLPDELERQLDALQYEDATGARVPLVARKTVVAPSLRAPVPELPPRYEGWLLALGGGIAAALGLSMVWARSGRLAPRRVSGGFQALIGILLGLPGTVLLIMWIVTNHTVTFHNENLFLANPFTLWLVPRGIALARGKPNAQDRLARVWYGLAGLGCLGVALKLLPAFDQDTSRALALLLPVLLGGAAGSFWVARARRSETKGTDDGGGREGASVGTSSAA